VGGHASGAPLALWPDLLVAAQRGLFCWWADRLGPPDTDCLTARPIPPPSFRLAMRMCRHRPEGTFPQSQVPFRDGQHALPTRGHSPPHGESEKRSPYTPGQFRSLQGFRVGRTTGNPNAVTARAPCRRRVVWLKRREDMQGNVVRRLRLSQARHWQGGLVNCAALRSGSDFDGGGFSVEAGVGLPGFRAPFGGGWVPCSTRAAQLCVGSC